MKLIIPMAGRGTRVRPHSHVTPKPLLNVKGKSMVERIIDTFVAVLPRGLDEAVFILGPDFGEEVRRQLAAICEKNDIQPYFRVQEKAQGTAHAVMCADDRLEGEGIVVFADTLFGMEPGVNLEGADVIAWVKQVDDPSRFGVAVRKGDKIVEFVEKPAEPISNEALIGIYYVKDLTRLRRAIDYLIENNVTGHGSEYQLTDAFDRLLKEGLVFKTAGVTEWLDCGTIEALLDTTKIILDTENGDLRQGRVENSVINEPVYIGPGALVSGSVVGPHVSIESGAQVSDSVIQDSIIFSDAQVDHAMLRDSLVGRHATIKGHVQRINVGDHTQLG